MARQERMPRRPRWLGADEELVRVMHTHAIVLGWPVVALLALSTGLGVGLAFLPPAWPTWSAWALAGLVALLVLVMVVAPVLRWRTSTWTLTTRRIVHRSGILTRRAHELPLNRINDVESERSLVDRMLGRGSLRLVTAAEDPVVLRDVPDVQHVHQMLSELLFAGELLPGRHQPAELTAPPRR